MRRTRFMSLFFLALAVAFFFVPDFRWALQLPFISGFQSDSMWRRALLSPGHLGRFAELPERNIVALAREAEKTGNARHLAFAALHWPYDQRQETFRLAELAVARDPKLTWLYYQVAARYYASLKETGTERTVLPWLDKVEAFDAGNSAPFLLLAELHVQRSLNWPPGRYVAGPEGQRYLEALAQQTQWRATMERAWDQERFDDYSVRRFDLERSVLQEKGWATPAIMLQFMATYPIPNLLRVREMSNFQAYLATQALAAGRTDEAIDRSMKSVAFGRKLRTGSACLIEDMIGMAVETINSEPLMTALRKAGRPQEAALVELHLREVHRGVGLFTKEPLAASSAFYWSSGLLHLCIFLVFFFGALMAVSIIYVNAKRWIRPQKRGRLYALITVAENYLPVLLFLGCLGLYVIYLPYASNFRHYMTATGEIHQLEPMIYNIYPTWEFVPQFSLVPVGTPFANYAGWALAALVVAGVLAGWEERRYRQSRAAPPTSRAAAAQ